MIYGAPIKGPLAVKRSQFAMLLGTFVETGEPVTYPWVGNTTPSCDQQISPTLFTGGQGPAWTLQIYSLQGAKGI